MCRGENFWSIPDGGGASLGGCLDRGEDGSSDPNMEEGLALITLDPDPYRQLPSVNQRQPVVGRVDPLGL